MTKFMRQWFLCDNAKDVTELELFDYDGYECYFESYPIYVTKFFYIIENLHYKNSLLRKKLHECKQRNHSLRKKPVNKKELYNEMLAYFLYRYKFEVLSQNIDLCVEARGYLRCMLMLAEETQIDRLHNYYDIISTYILGNKL